MKTTLTTLALLLSLSIPPAHADPGDAQTDGYEGVDLTSPLKSHYEISLGHHAEFGSDSAERGGSQILMLAWKSGFTNYGAEGPGNPLVKFFKVRVGLRQDGAQFFPPGSLGNFGEIKGALSDPHSCDTGTGGGTTGGGTNGGGNTIHPGRGNNNRYTPSAQTAVGGNDFGWMLEVVPYSLERSSGDHYSRDYWAIELLTTRVSQGFEDPTATIGRMNMFSFGGKGERMLTPKIRATIEHFSHLGWYILSRFGTTEFDKGQLGGHVKAGIRVFIDPQWFADFTATARTQFVGQFDTEAYLRAAISRAQFIQKGDRLEIFLTAGARYGYFYRDKDRTPPNRMRGPDESETNLFSNIGLRYSK